MNDKYSILWLCTFSSKMTHSTEQQNPAVIDQKNAELFKLVIKA